MHRKAGKARERPVLGRFCGRLAGSEAGLRGPPGAEASRFAQLASVSAGNQVFLVAAVRGKQRGLRVIGAERQERNR
jgi:hypothetical protein